jgi:hypothetical protein
VTRNFLESADALRSDGAFRDFYVHNTSRGDWNAVLHQMRSKLEAGCFTVDGDSRDLPQTFEEIEQIRAQGCPCLSIPVAGAYVCCHFFCHDQIELNFRPEDYRTPERWSELSGFLQSIVDTVAKPGVVTYENVEDDVIETFEPTRNVEQTRCSEPSDGVPVNNRGSAAPGQ